MGGVRMDIGDIQRGDGNKQREMDNRKWNGIDMTWGCTQTQGMEINIG